jgi:hypothetical protein
MDYTDILNHGFKAILDLANAYLPVVVDGKLSLLAGGGSDHAFSLALAAVAAVPGGRGKIPEGLLAILHRWHGTYHERFVNLANFASTLQAHKDWPVPAWLPAFVTDLGELRGLMEKCESNTASPLDRARRDTLIDAMVKRCKSEGLVYAQDACLQGLITRDDVHSLGFLMPGETGGYHGRVEPTRVIALCKVTVLNPDFVEIVVDQSTGENAAQVKNGWPPGVKHVAISIIAVEGRAEVLRKISTHQHNTIEMPAGSRGKEFIATAAFLQHVDDAPLFGNEETFSMPLRTRDMLND